MILKVAWRNIWRNKLRSSVVIATISLGLVAGIFSSAFVQGMMMQKVENVILKEMSHFQVHHKDFREEKQVGFVIDNGKEIQEDIASHEKVEATSGRVKVFETSVEFSGNMTSLILNGVVPEDEALVSRLNEDLVEGAYFEGIKKNPILISKETADEYGVGLESPVVFSFLDVNGVQQKMKCRVAGIYETGNKMLDKMNAYVVKSDLQAVLAMEENQLHEIAVFLNDYEAAEPLAQEYQSKYEELEIIPWLDLSTGMRYMIEAMGMYTVILVGIILFALLFGVVNTMLMAVLERTKEIGMLMAVGMKKQKVFTMIILETLFLALIGGPLGLLFSWLLISHFGEVGINLGDAAYGEMGFASVIHPYLGGMEYIKVAIMVFFMALIASIFPSIKALRLKPVEAIRKI